MAKAVNPARLELMGKNPVVLLDGAHNPNGIELNAGFTTHHMEEGLIKEEVIKRSYMSFGGGDAYLSVAQGLFVEGGVINNADLSTCRNSRYLTMR